MLGKIDSSPQLDLYQIPIRDTVGDQNPLVLLSSRINWENIESELGKFYASHRGRPGIPVRKIAGMIILKRIFELNYEKLMQYWLKDIACQFFCGEIYPLTNPAFAKSEFFRFRRRIGDDGMKIIDNEFNKITQTELLNLREYMLNLENPKSKSSLFSRVWQYLKLQK